MADTLLPTLLQRPALRATGSTEYSPPTKVADEVRLMDPAGREWRIEYVRIDTNHVNRWLSRGWAAFVRTNSITPGGC
jgi:hypothetical protein